MLPTQSWARAQPPVGSPRPPAALTGGRGCGIYAGDDSRAAQRQADAARIRAVELCRRAQAARTRAAAVMGALAKTVHMMHPAAVPISRQEPLQELELARLRARLASLPVIEQAKGIVMVQNQCGPDEAFDVLRRASQRANIKVSVLAILLVEQVSSPLSGRNGQRARSAARRTAN